MRQSSCSIVLMVIPYFSASLAQFLHGSIGRSSPDRPTRQITIVCIRWPNFSINLFSQCSAVPARPIGVFSRTCHLLWLLVQCPRTFPFFEKAIPLMRYVQGLCIAFFFKSSSIAIDTFAFLLTLYPTVNSRWTALSPSRSSRSKTTLPMKPIDSKHRMTSLTSELTSSFQP